MGRSQQKHFRALQRSVLEGRFARMAVVRYLVAELDKSISFYERLFGFKVNQKWGNAVAGVVREFSAAKPTQPANAQAS